MKLIEFAGARRIPLIGRRDLLQEAERRIGRGGVHLLYLEGRGGVGKTALLEAILEKSQRSGRTDSSTGCCVAQQVIDLYHIDVHTYEGLIRKIVQVLGKWSFEESQRLSAALDQARVSGDVDAVREHEKALRASFLQEFAALSQAGVVLAFDTLEVLEYEHDPFQQELGEPVPALSAGKWLLESFLSALQGNVVVLLAGRSADLVPRLEALHEQQEHLLVRHIELQPLDAQETKEYLKAVAQAEGLRGDGDAASRLWTFSEERADIAHFLTGGRPILLALVADMVAQDLALPSPFDQTHEQILARHIGDWWPDVERALVVRIQESDTPIGNTFRALAWLRKGATPDLLAQVLGLKTKDGEWDRYTATGYLEQAAQLALVKVRPGDSRVFLHDEMYALLDTHVLQKAGEEERSRVYSIIRAHYRDQIRQLEQRIEKPSALLASIQSHLHQALVEEMHYRLCQSPPMGFAMYFWLAEEALGGRNAEMDMLVRSEFLRTLSMLEETECFLGAIPREAALDTAVRWGMRALFLHSDPEAALRILDQARKRWSRDAGKLELAWAHLELYRALAKIQRSSGDDLPEARELLAAVEETADRVLTFPPEKPVVQARRWRAKVLKSLALNYLGYLDRRQGRYREAVRHYQESAMLQRRLGMDALASTLTNLSFVMAATGDSHPARLLAEEAERLTRRRGQDHMLATTLNVRALVEEFDGHHQSALRYTDRALEVAARLPNQRVQGLIRSTRARASRYLWASLPDAEKSREVCLVDEALNDANQAVSLLRAAPVDRVAALQERGCIYRELARLYQAEGRTAEAEEVVRKGRDDLERAAVLGAAINLTRQQALAWIDLGWLSYYLGKTEEVHDTLRKAYEPFPSDYRFPAQGSTPPMADAQHRQEAALPLWGALGEAEMLGAHLALDQAMVVSDNGSQEEPLLAAVKHITLSLAYHELMGESQFELIRAEENLHKRIIQDGFSIKLLHQHALQVAKAQGLQQPTRFQGFLTRLFGPADLWT
jgi:tetratricopeptide (TPR) repeat protein